MYNNKKLLILGGSEFQIPLVLKAKELGIITYIVDINSDAPALKYADYSYQLSVKNKEEILKIAKEIMPDGVTVGMVDLAIPTYAYIAKELNLPGISIDSALKATNKYEMIKSFKENNVPHPKFEYISKDFINYDLNKTFKFPVIVKPIDMAGSRGIYLVNNKNELINAIAESSKISDTGNLLIEEYMTGPEVSVELVVKDGIPHVIQITDKTTNGAPHFAETGHLQPSTLSSDIKEKISEVACCAAKSVGLINSLGHAEIKVTDEGPKMVEIGARAGGDAIGEQLIFLSTGVDFSQIAIDIAFGVEINIPAKKEKASCIRFIQSKNGILKNVSGINDAEKIENVFKVHFNGVVGKKYDDVIDNSGRLGYIITKGDNAVTALNACNKAIDCIKVEYEDRCNNE